MQSTAMEVIMIPILKSQREKPSRLHRHGLNSTLSNLNETIPSEPMSTNNVDNGSSFQIGSLCVVNDLKDVLKVLRKLEIEFISQENIRHSLNHTKKKNHWVLQRRLRAAKFIAPLGFGTRLQIALGAARGILYLHTEVDPPIIHHDVKVNNILLDSKLTAKKSDFGISRLAPVSDAQGDTTAHVSTTVKGTPFTTLDDAIEKLKFDVAGYVEPEYFLTHKLTEKSDVYSLGIVFLELLTGMQPISHGRNIVREVNAACQRGMMFTTIDRSMGQYPSEELENILSMLPESGSTALELNLNVSSCGTSSTSIPTFSVGGALMDLIPGSDLVSGVIPTIKPQ
ncbi:putative LRR receptor-like serine/threonine-protein kinase [Dorcoceras hygrometricum]|uniref:Putative LRR receptor-like serine/threonine-protein kinase n=1 Tax=Dorcoceras hygrometricum TaxID=472368 RepID=A0A2Z7C835_9LAMI|nr:putative LRR receptor-like serine/threonine-protein kinase [Dorcoceras hygrometricum]